MHTHTHLGFARIYLKFAPIMVSISVRRYDFLRQKDVPPLRKYWAEGGAGVNGFAKDKAFFAEGMRFGGTLWDYYSEFLQHLNDPSVLCLVFEDMVEDIEAQLPAIVAFMGLKLSAYGAKEVAAMCSKGFMTDPKHTSKFDESWTYQRMGELGECSGICTTPPLHQTPRTHAPNASAV
jgi:hypothetical protein